MTSRVPLIIAIVVLLLPILYVGSYLALVLPEGQFDARIPGYVNYRYGGRAAEWLFWPLEQSDRKLRSGTCEAFHDDNGSPY